MVEMKDTKFILALGVLAIVVLGGVYFIAGGVKPSALAIAPTGEGGAAVPTSYCPDSDITLTTSLLDMYNQGAGNNDTLTVLWQKNGEGIFEYFGQSNSGAAFTPATNTEVILFAYDDNSTSADSAANWYGTETAYTVGCNDHLISSKMCRVGSPTITVWNDDDTVNAVSANQTMDSNDAEYNMKLRIKAPSDACFGAPSEGVIKTARYTDTAGSAGIYMCADFQTDAIKNVYLDPYKVRSVGIPTHLASVADECTELNENSFMDLAEQDYDLIVKTAAAGNPATAVRNGWFSVFLLDSGKVINADTNNIISGVEDEDGNDMYAGTFSTNTTVYCD